jgi:hypothetical protein
MTRIAAIAALAMLLAGPASAHSLRLTLAAEPGCLTGEITYSDGWAGDGEIAVVGRVDASVQPERVAANAAGRFSIKATPGRYRVKVSGNEEHEVEREVEVPPGATDAACEPFVRLDIGPVPR